MARNYTHQVTVVQEVSTYERMLQDAEKLMADYVANGYWTQEAADRSIAHHQDNLDEARKQERFQLSRHMSLKGAQKGLKDAQNDARWKHARIEEI